MPLSAPTLISQLQSLATSPPATTAQCAQAWADAMQAYAAAIIPASTTVSAAASALSSSLVGAFNAPLAAPGMEVAFTSFAATVGAGMAAAGFAPVPPVTPVGFVTLFAGPKPATHADAAQQIGSQIDTWMKTGVATLIAPPNTPTPWT